MAFRLLLKNIYINIATLVIHIRFDSEGGKKSIPNMLTEIRVCGISSGKLIKVTAVLCSGRLSSRISRSRTRVMMSPKQA